MITPTQMYWLTRLTLLNDLLAFGGITTFLMGVGFLIAYGYDFVNGDDDFKMCKLLGIRTLVLSLFLFAGYVFLPTTKQMAAILIVPRIANSEKVQTVGNSIYDLALSWMEELKPAKAKGESK